MNWTGKLLAVALATVASLSLDSCTQTPNPPLLVGEEPRTAREKMKLFSMESVGACGRRFGHYSGAGQGSDFCHGYPFTWRKEADRSLTADPGDFLA